MILWKNPVVTTPFRGETAFVSATAYCMGMDCLVEAGGHEYFIQNKQRNKSLSTACCTFGFQGQASQSKRQHNIPFCKYNLLLKLIINPSITVYCTLHHQKSAGRKIRTEKGQCVGQIPVNITYFYSALFPACHPFSWLLPGALKKKKQSDENTCNFSIAGVNIGNGLRRENQYVIGKRKCH